MEVAVAVTGEEILQLEIRAAVPDAVQRRGHRARAGLDAARQQTQVVVARALLE